MSTLLWLAVLTLSAGLAYSVIFSEVTLAIGRSLGDGHLVTGYQAALTPPWQTRLSLLVYALTLVVITLSWYEFGAVRGVATIVILIAGLGVWRRILPAGHSSHYLKLIVVSMATRYADWVREGDAVRAAAMAELLDRMGLSLPAAPRRADRTHA